MKRLLIISLLFVAIACNRNIPETNPDDPITIKRLTTSETFNVPVKDGFTTYVTIGSDTLCITNKETSILVPKGITKLKSGESQLNISYVEGTDPLAGTMKKWQTIAFEDSPSGDYDYNDIVIHCSYQMKGSRFGIGVHPIALGSTKNIALCYKIFVNNELKFEDVACSNCRTTLFDGKENFINTATIPNFHTNYFKFHKVIEDIGTTISSEISVIWYIVVDSGLKLFSVNDKYGCLDKNGRPYGLIITDTGNSYYQDERNPNIGTNWFAYPFEGINIEQAYPGFKGWVEGSTQNCDFSTPNSGTTIDPDTYKFNRSDVGPTRIYYFPSGTKLL